MRIVGLKEFMELKNILYVSYTGPYGEFEDSCFEIKWENCGVPKYNDWVYSSLSPSSIYFESGYCDDGVISLDKAKFDSNFTIPMDFEFAGRAGLYLTEEDNLKFAVYEKEDIKNMINVLQKLLVCSE